MSRIVLLDAGPLGMVTNPRATAVTEEARDWLRTLLQAGAEVLVPEITDYEVRRELLRAARLQAIARLDRLKAAMGYLPLTTEVMLLAAQFWAEARAHGRPTADRHSLDGDVILAAQAAVLHRGGHDVTVATTNPEHLSRFVDARTWREVR